MRPLPLVAAIVMLSLLSTFPPANAAAGSGVSLTGPTDAIRTDGPAQTTLKIALTLDGVTCAGNGDIPVRLKVADTKGLRSASLTWEEVLFRVAPTTASAAPWTGRSEVGLRVWAQDPTGLATVMASYALPSHCVSSKGATSGQATYTVHVKGPEPAPQAELPPEMPPLQQRTQEMAYAQESQEVAKPVVSLPAPVLGAIAGMCLGGAVVFYKRMRAASFV